jgi:hypothetical protein
MQFGTSYVRIGHEYLSTKTGKRFPATPEGLQQLNDDNRLVFSAAAGREALPQKPRSVGFRIAQEIADKNPTSEVNPWKIQADASRALFARSNFQDKWREEEIAELEDAARRYDDRRAKLLELPQPAPEVIDPLRQAASLLRDRPDKLGAKLSESVARRLEEQADKQDAEIEAQKREDARINDPTYQRACKYLELEIHRFEREIVPQEWIESAKSQLEQVKSGALSPHEWWHAFQPERVNEQAAYYETLAKRKQEEIAPHLAELERIKAGDLKPADSPAANPPDALLIESYRRQPTADDKPVDPQPEGQQ